MFPRFLFFKKLSTFTEWSSNPSNAQYEGDLYFIQDESCIYTHGHKFKCSIDTSDVNSLLEEYCKVENPLSETDVITEESFTDNITYQLFLLKLLKLVLDNNKNLTDTINGLTVNGYKVTTSPNLTKSDIGLDNVDNTSDVDKPISTETKEYVDASIKLLNEQTIAKLLEQVNDNKDAIDIILKDFGYYGDISSEELILEIDESNYAVSTDGTKISLSGYAISKPVSLTQGNIYLIKAEAVDSKVSMFARRSIVSQTDRITYTYTYNTDDGRPLIAIPDYNSKLVYTYNYTESQSEEGTTTYHLENITSSDGETIDELPSTRTYDVEVFNALFKTGAIATPKSGYYVYFCPTSMDIIVSAKASDLKTNADDEAKGKMYGVRYGIFASIASNYVNRWERDELDARITALELKHEQDDFNQGKYCVAVWDSNDSADSVKTYGDELFLLDTYDMVLVDCNDSADETTQVVHVLKRDNLFRTKFGDYAPSVYITDTDYNDSTLELFLLTDGEYVQYCEAGAYNAEDYVTNVLRPVVQETPNDLSKAKLYKLVDDQYVEAHAVLPWETNYIDYTHGLANTLDLYLIDNVEGNSGIIWSGIFNYPAVWDGIDTKLYRLKPTAMFLSPFTTINGKARSFFYLKTGETNCTSFYGYGTNTSFLDRTRTYPRTNDVSQVTSQKTARSNNSAFSASDNPTPVPFAEGGYFTNNTYITALEVGNHTKYIHKNTRFGSGISSNDSCSNESTWLLNGGCRYEVDGVLKYCTLGSNPTNVYYNTSKGTSNLSNLINQYAPLEQSEESQTAYSWAKEFGIAENMHFLMYGAEYWYIDNPEAASGYMNARVYKKISFTYHGYNASGEAIDVPMDLILRMSLFGGMNLSGDIWENHAGGYEHIGTCNSDKTANGTYGHLIDMYIQPDLSKWVYDTSVTLNNLGRFKCEDSYYYLGSYTTVTNGYMKKRHSYAPDKKVNGGSISVNQCAYYYEYKYWSSVANSRTRVYALLRSRAGYTDCAPRSCYAGYSVGATYRFYGGAAQVRIRL